MSGFNRQPTLAAQAATRQRVHGFISTAAIAAANASQDPFNIDDPCPQNAGGLHRFIGSCGDVVCCHCSRVAWQ